MSSWKEKYNKKYGFKKSDSHSLSDISKTTGISKKGIQEIYNKGIGAYKTNPQSVRPTVTSKEQWAYGRVYSAVMGGKASKVDAKELKMDMGGTIECGSCDWSWDEKDGGNDMYVCHKCGTDNTEKYMIEDEKSKSVNDRILELKYILKYDTEGRSEKQLRKLDDELTYLIRSSFRTGGKIQYVKPISSNEDDRIEFYKGYYKRLSPEGVEVERNQNNLYITGIEEKQFAKGGQTDFNPDGQIKGKVVHASGDAGGMLVGKRHSEGGIKAVNKSTGQPLEMEGGEVVITRGAVSDNKKRSFNGKMMTNRQILSEINESGGGVSFADGGELPNQVNFDCEANYEYGGNTMCGKDLAFAMGGTVTTAIVTDPNEAMADLQSTYGFGDVYGNGGKVEDDVWKSIVSKFLNEFYGDYEDDTWEDYVDSDSVESIQTKYKKTSGRYDREVSFEEAYQTFKSSLTPKELKSIEVSFDEGEYADAEEHDEDKNWNSITIRKVGTYAKGGTIAEKYKNDLFPPTIGYPIIPSFEILFNNGRYQLVDIVNTDIISNNNLLQVPIYEQYGSTSYFDIKQNKTGYARKDYSTGSYELKDLEDVSTNIITKDYLKLNPKESVKKAYDEKQLKVFQDGWEKNVVNTLDGFETKFGKKRYKWQVFQSYDEDRKIIPFSYQIFLNKMFGKKDLAMGVDKRAVNSGFNWSAPVLRRVLLKQDILTGDYFDNPLEFYSLNELVDYYIELSKQKRVGTTYSNLILEYKNSNNEIAENMLTLTGKKREPSSRNYNYYASFGNNGVEKDPSNFIFKFFMGMQVKNRRYDINQPLNCIPFILGDSDLAKKYQEQKNKAEEELKIRLKAEKETQDILDKFVFENYPPLKADAQSKLNSLISQEVELTKLLPFFKGVTNSIQRMKILNELRKNYLAQEDLRLTNPEDVFEFISPSFLLDYYFTQTTQSPVVKLKKASKLDSINFKESQLPLGAYVNVRTEKFKSFFGDWESAYVDDNYTNCSKMINEETKEPKIFYHGVRKFQKGIGGGAMGSGVTRPFGAFTPTDFPASYFSDKLSYAEFYSGQSTNLPKPVRSDGFIYPVFLNIRNPLDLTPLGFEASFKDFREFIILSIGVKIDYTKQILEKIKDVNEPNPVWTYIRNDIRILEILKRAGVDGLIQIGDIPKYDSKGEVVKNRKEWIQEVEYLTFYPNQIKSATTKKSMYSSLFEDIRFKSGGYVSI